MTEKYISQEFRLKKIKEINKYFFKKQAKMNCRVKGTKKMHDSKLR